MSNKLIKGTALLTGAAFISKFLGMVYVIPFNELVGAQGGELYYYAYNPYTILIAISTVGIPLAVSKMVSKYNSLGYYDVGFKIFRLSSILMLITGMIAFLILFFGSEWLATKYAYDTEHGSTVADLKLVLQMISFSLIIIPAMSVVRGFFQGYHMMEPTAISQVVEQIIRIVFVLSGAFVVVKILDKGIVSAVGVATFAAFIGAFASVAVLFYYWVKKKREMHENVVAQQKSIYISNKDLIFELLSYAGPFVIVGIATPLYQAVDSFTFNKAMALGGFGELTTVSLATINMYGHKLIMIPVTIAIGLSMAIIPGLTESFTQHNTQKLKKEINQSLQIVLFFVIPAVVGLSVLSYEAYGALFGMNQLDVSGNLLRWYAPVALLFALFTVSAAILQGINEQRFALVSLSAGFIVKLSLNSMFIQQFAGKGSIFGTALAVGTAVVLNLWWIKRSIIFSYKQTAKRTLFVIIFSGMMALAIVVMKSIFGLFLPYETSRFAAAVMLTIGVGVGGIVYLVLAYKSTLMEHVLGTMNIMNRFRRKKRAN